MTESAIETIAAARPEAVCVCAFGALITEPLLSRWEMLNVHPVAAAALARRRSDRAGDHERRRGHRACRSCASARGSTTGRCAPRRPSRSGRGTPTARSRSGSRSSEPSCSCGRSTSGRRASQQDEALATYAAQDQPRRTASSMPARTAVELERVVRALTPHIGAYVSLGRRHVARGDRRRARSADGGPARGRGLLRRAGSGARMRVGRARAAHGAASGPPPDERRGLPARAPEVAAWRRRRATAGSRRRGRARCA